MLLNLLGKAVRGRKDLNRAALPKFYHLKGGVNLGTGRAKYADSRRVVYTLGSSKCRRGLNPSLVKDLIPYLEVVVSTYLRDLNPEGLFSLPS